MWFVPLTGCLGLILLPALLLAGLAAFGIGMLNSSPAYERALAEARSHPVVIDRLGEPIEAGWTFSGRFEFSDGSREIEMEIPVSGPRGSGRLHVEAARVDGEWELLSLVLELEHSEDRIDLLAPSLERVVSRP